MRTGTVVETQQREVKTIELKIGAIGRRAHGWLERVSPGTESQDSCKIFEVSERMCLRTESYDS